MNTAEAPAPERPQTKPFAQFLQEQRGGLLHAELSDTLADVVARVVEHGKPGTITVQFKVQPNKDGVTLTVFDDVKVKAPQGDRGAAIFYADGHGNLSRRDPRQPELPLRPVETTTTVAAPAEATGTEG